MSHPPRFTQSPYGEARDAPPVGPPIGYGTGPRMPETPAEFGPGEAIFDLTFDRYATPSIARLAYGIALVFAGLSVAGMIALGIWGLIAGSFFFGPFLLWGILAIPLALLGLLSLRVVLETCLAAVRTAQELRHLRLRSGSVETRY